jgi:polyhydroxybutyrate depolymerase
MTVLAPRAEAQGTDSTYSIERGKLRRTYLLHTPSSSTAHSPLVILLHGRLGTGPGMARLTGFDRLGDRIGAVVAYPNGVSRSWADGRGFTPADQQQVDDVGFVSALIDDVARRRGIDRGRVYVAGLSNGGFFALRLGCELSDRLAGIGVIAATFSDALMARCHPHRPLPVIVIDGTADPLVPYSGGTMQGKRGHVQSAETTAAVWARVNGCQGQPGSRTLPDTADDGTTVTEMRYGGCPARTPVTLYRIGNGGHAWPGGEVYLPQAVIGKVSRNLDANTELWRFWTGVQSAP